jgi:hypothetical protein
MTPPEQRLIAKYVLATVGSRTEPRRTLFLATGKVCPQGKPWDRRNLPWCRLEAAKRRRPDERLRQRSRPASGYQSYTYRQTFIMVAVAISQRSKDMPSMAKKDRISQNKRALDRYLYGSQGAAGPAVSLVTGEVLKATEGPPRPKDRRRPALNGDRAYLVVPFDQRDQGQGAWRPMGPEASPMVDIGHGRPRAVRRMKAVSMTVGGRAGPRFGPTVGANRPDPAWHIARRCRVGSFDTHDRTPEIIAGVRRWQAQVASLVIELPSADVVPMRRGAA